MGLSRSQLLALSGGAALIVGAFLPLAIDGEVVVRMLGASTPARDGEPSQGLRTTLAVVGTITVLYGAIVILLSTWWSSARHLLVPAVVGLIAVLAFVVISGTRDVEPGAGALAMLAGHALTLAAAARDRRNYRSATRPTSNDDGLP